ncbi:MAG: Dabb family protein, partial [Muribaculaceae bacterium]|nr:Dabb family protein [Muribaculaceae bacterium]
VLTAVIDKMENVAVYANHPAHVAAASIIGGSKELRGCVDYEF